jgi:hypothetical protein
MKTTQTPYNVQFDLTVTTVVENRYLESFPTDLTIIDPSLNSKGKEAPWRVPSVFGEGDEAGKNQSQNVKEQER